MDTRLFQRVGIACFVEDIGLSFGKIDEYGDRFANETLNLVHNIALELAPIDSRAYSTHLLGRISHRDEKHVLVLRRKRHGGKDEVADVSRSGRV